MSKTSKHSTSQILDNSEPPPPPPPGAHLCTEGEYSPFILEAISPMPSLDIVKQIIPDSMGVFPPQPTEANIRLEACYLDSDEFSLNGMIYLEKLQQGTVNLLLPVGEIVGLKEALFGDPSTLVASFEGSVFRYDLRGYNKDGLSFVAMQRRFKNGRNANMLTMIGNLKFGNFPGSGDCDIGKVLVPIRWQFEQVDIDVEVCAWGFGLGTGTMYYEYKKLTIVDASTSLPENIRNQPITLKKEQMANTDIFKFQQNHHNSCDAVVIALPHAEYSLTGGETFTIGSGCRGFHSALPRTNQESPAERESKSIYRIRRGNGDWVKGYFDRGRLVWQ